jgi:hypothetical protein
MHMRNEMGRVLSGYNPTRRTSMYMKKKKMWITTPTIVCSVPITERVSFSATARLRRSLPSQKADLRPVKATSIQR